jgi:hypothetical protein
MKVKIRCECVSLRIPDLGIIMIRGEDRIVDSHSFTTSKFLSRALDSGAVRVLDGSKPIEKIQNTKDLMEYLNLSKDMRAQRLNEAPTLRELGRLQDTVKMLSDKLDQLQQAPATVEVREKVVVKEVPAPQQESALSIELLQALMDKVDKISSAPPQVVTQYVTAQETQASLSPDVVDEGDMVFIPKTISNSSLEADVKVSSNKSEASSSFEEASKALKSRPKRSKRKKNTGDSK